MTGGKQGARDFDGARMRQRRLAAGMTQRQIAREIDVSESVVAHWERGAQLPTVERAAALARLLGVAPADLTTTGDDDTAHAVARATFLHDQHRPQSQSAAKHGRSPLPRQLHPIVPANRGRCARVDRRVPVRRAGGGSRTPQDAGARLTAARQPHHARVPARPVVPGQRRSWTCGRSAIVGWVPGRSCPSCPFR
jgi:transcriptional regulator with XRE-family HTH domain